MTELLDIKVKVLKKVSTENGARYALSAILEGVYLQDIINAVNTALVAKGSSRRIGEVQE